MQSTLLILKHHLYSSGSPTDAANFFATIKHRADNWASTQRVFK
jgi:hypothetical protein